MRDIVVKRDKTRTSCVTRTDRQKRGATNTKFDTAVGGSRPLPYSQYISGAYIVPFFSDARPFLLFSTISDYRALSSPHVVYVELPKIAG